MKKPRLPPGLWVERVDSESVEPTPIKTRPVCPRQPGIITDRLTGKSFPARCGTWACPVCGNQKKRRLIAATIQAFSQQKFLALWTFTLSSDLGWTVDEHALVMRGAWRRLVIKVRQKWWGRISTANLKFFRVVEQHKSGHVHFHVMMNQFLNKERMKLLWMLCVIREAEALGLSIPYDRKICDANVAKSRNHGRPSPKAIACYVAKYVTKTLCPAWVANSPRAHLKACRRVWSASRGFVTIALKSRSYNSIKCWAFRRGTHSGFCDGEGHRLYLFPYRAMLQGSGEHSDNEPPERTPSQASFPFN